MDLSPRVGGCHRSHPGPIVRYRANAEDVFRSSPLAALPTRCAHAACLRASTSRSYSTGLRYPRLECRRSQLYQVSMYTKIAWRAASRVGQSASIITSVSKVAKKLSATALSQQSPLLLMLAASPWAARSARYSPHAY